MKLAGYVLPMLLVLPFSLTLNAQPIVQSPSPVGSGKLSG